MYPSTDKYRMNIEEDWVRRSGREGDRFWKIDRWDWERRMN